MSTRTKGIQAFFRYARARQQILLDRRAGKPKPWTKDEILSKYRFCCVFREDDRTTQWFREHVREPLCDSPRVLLATVVFRLFNRIETGEAIFCDDALLGIEHSAFAEFAEFGDVRVLKRAILKRLGKRGPYVTGAYIISSPPGYAKLDGVLEVIRRFYKNSGWRSWSQSDGLQYSLEETWDWLSKQDYLGKFHSYEIVTDLRHTYLLGGAEDIMSWANPGPGAHRGANRIFRGDKSARVPRSQVIDEMRVLLSWSRDPKLWPPGEDIAGWPAWDMRTVEHTLCEFDKYERVRTGEGRPRSVYR